MGYQWFVEDARTLGQVSGVEDTVDAAKEAAMKSYIASNGIVAERVDITVDTEDGYWIAGRQNETWDKEAKAYRQDFFRWRFVSD